jgi:hypothetical protein
MRSCRYPSGMGAFAKGAGMDHNRRAQLARGRRADQACGIFPEMRHGIRA